VKDYKLTLPSLLRDTPASTLQTDFKSSIRFAAGPDAHTFAASIVIHEDETQTPAVANANLLIMRLCADPGTALVGSLSLQLDDGYSDAVLAPIALNFAYTAGTDEVAVAIDESSRQITLTNQSPFDLRISRYAFVRSDSLSLVPGAVPLPQGEAV